MKACAQHTACKAAVGLGAASIAGEAAIKKASEWMIEHVWGKRDLKDLGETHNWVRDNNYVDNFFRTDHGRTFFLSFTCQPWICLGCLMNYNEYKSFLAANSCIISSNEIVNYDLFTRCEAHRLPMISNDITSSTLPNLFYI